MEAALPKCPPSLRHSVIVQTRTQASDGQGGYTDTWADTVTLWCSIEPLKGYERYQAGQMQTPVTHKLMMRYNANVTTDSRLKFGDRTLYVVEVIDQEERNRWLVVKAVERQ
jgi:SPP1 family predicted phage head-tail adaptor